MAQSLAAPNICVGTSKPALLNAGERARLGDDRVRMFRVTNVPQRRSEVVAVLIDGKRLILDFVGNTQREIMIPTGRGSRALTLQS